MNLLEAQKRLAEDGVSDHYRYFIDTYRVHDYKEETLLKEYIDYISHEPLLWLQSFPAKLKSKPAFSKPKTAILKLLKDSKVSTKVDRLKMSRLPVERSSATGLNVAQEDSLTWKELAQHWAGR